MQKNHASPLYPIIPKAGNIIPTCFHIIKPAWCFSVFINIHEIFADFRFSESYDIFLSSNFFYFKQYIRNLKKLLKWCSYDVIGLWYDVTFNKDLRTYPPPHPILLLLLNLAISLPFVFTSFLDRFSIVFGSFWIVFGLFWIV